MADPHPSETPERPRAILALYFSSLVVLKDTPPQMLIADDIYQLSFWYAHLQRTSGGAPYRTRGFETAILGV
jgi:hypothetical protein